MKTLSEGNKITSFESSSLKFALQHDAVNTTVTRNHPAKLPVKEGNTLTSREWGIVLRPVPDFRLSSDWILRPGPVCRSSLMEKEKKMRNSSNAKCSWNTINQRPSIRQAERLQFSRMQPAAQATSRLAAGATSVRPSRFFRAEQHANSSLCPALVIF